MEKDCVGGQIFFFPNRLYFLQERKTSKRDMCSFAMMSEAVGVQPCISRMFSTENIKKLRFKLF